MIILQRLISVGDQKRHLCFRYIKNLIEETDRGLFGDNQLKKI